MNILLLRKKAKPYLGFVASRAGSVHYNIPEYKYANSRGFMYARDNISDAAIILPAWNGSEHATGNITFTASIEYPAGTFTQMKFSGSTSITAISGTTVVSDIVELTTPIPNGAMFWVRVFQNAPSGMIYGASLYTANGDALEYSTSAIGDKTMSGTLSNMVGGFPLLPLGVIGYTTKPSVLLVGDSRMKTSIDSDDTTGDLGEVARSIGPYFGYSNVGSYGELAFGFISTHSLRLALAQYCSHVICQYGVNDLQNGVSATTLQTNLSTIWGYFKSQGKKVFQTTISPKTTSSDGWATLGNQTAATYFPLDGTGARDTVNTWIRTSPYPLTGMFDTTLGVETAMNSDYWKYPNYTTDGLHANRTGCLSIKNGGYINPGRIRR